MRKANGAVIYVRVRHDLCLPGEEVIAKLDREHGVQRDGRPVVGKCQVAVQQEQAIKHRIPPL